MSTPAGAVAMAALVMIAGSAYLLAGAKAEVKVGVVMVTVTHSAMATTDEFGELPIEFIQAPHCSAASFSRDTRTLTVFNSGLDAAIRNVVFVRYEGPGSFSGGGDNTQVFFLRQGEAAVIGGALSRGHGLYEIRPGTADPMAMLAANETAPNTVDARYVVNGTLNLWPQAWGQNGTFVVQEHHEAEAFGGVQVRNQGPRMCA